MIVLGLVLLVLAAVLGVGVVVSNPDVLNLSLFGAQVPVTMAGLFFTGAGTMVVVAVALWLIRRGIAGARRRRRERRALPAPTQSTQTFTSSSPEKATAPSARTAPSPAATPARSSSATRTPAPASAPSGEDGRTSRTEPTGSSTPAERAALLAESNDLTRDDPPR